MSFLDDLLGLPVDMSGLGDISGNVPDPLTYKDFVPTVLPTTSWEDEYNKLIGGGSNPNDTTFNNIFSPSNAEIFKNIDLAQLERSDVTNAINKALGTNYTGKQLAAMAAVAGGGIAGLSGAMNPNATKVGYQGSIPKYDAVRDMVTAPPTRAQGYRPGQGGINYGGDVSYVPKGTAGSAGGSSGGGGSGGGSSTLSDLAKVGGVGGLGYLAANALAGGSANKQPVKSDDPFYQSAEYKAFLNDPANMYATADMYNSPYFGTVSSGSTGRAMDKAYQQYLLNNRQNSQGSDMGGGGGLGAAGVGTSGPSIGTSGGLSGTSIGNSPIGAMIGTIANAIEGVNLANMNTNNNIPVVDMSPSGQADAAAAGLAAADGVGSSGMGVGIGEGSVGTSPGGGSGSPGGDGSSPGSAGAYARGGLMGLAKGRYLQGETDGMADKIPARIGKDQPAALSHGEFVVPADVVSHLGNGNSDAGAKKLYGMMDKIRQARTGTKQQGKQINPDKFMPGGEVKRLNVGGTTSSSEMSRALSAGASGMEQAPNTFAGEYIGDMLGKTQALANAPYQQYMGPLTAGESGLQSKVFGGLQSANFPSNLGQSFSSAGAYQPPTMNMDAYKTQPIGAQPGATTSPQPSPAGGIQQPQGLASQYMNPYLQNVLTPQMEELRRQAQINNLSGLGALTKSGAFGGGRQAIMESEAGRNLLQEQNKALGQGYANAFDKAQQQFNTEQAQGMGLTKLMAEQGSAQRGIESEGIAADKAAFEEARLNPYKMLQFQQSMLSGMPISATNYSLPTPSALTGAAQGATTTYNLLKNLGLIT